MHRPAHVILGLLISLLCLQALGKKDKPDIEETKFESIPYNLLYFDDSDVVLLTDPEAEVTYRSTDAGATWKALDGVPKGEVVTVLKHPYDTKVAVVVGQGKSHWITKDQGQSWKEFRTQNPPSLARLPFVFHASDSNRILFLGADCIGFACEDSVYYTTDGFKTDPELLHDDAISCIWAKTTDLFTTGDDELDADQILCNVRGEFSSFMSSNRLLISNDYFKTKGVEPAMEGGRPVSGVVNIAAVKSYLVVAAKSEGSNELAMYVSDDATTWHRAEFGEHKLEEDAYTLLESTNYSMQVDVMTTRSFSPPMGVLYTSNSNGTFFTKNIEHTNRNRRGFVDFEKVQNIQGIAMVNIVDNWEDVEHSLLTDKKLMTQISFDDGRTWQGLKAGNKDLHLHSVTDQRNVGRIFSSPAPGIVMGVGNTGKYLSNREGGDTWVSDDAGLTWTQALQKPHLYEMGDQGALLVAIEDAETDEIKYSLDHGKKWDTVQLKDKVHPLALTTTPDSTSLKFLLTADKGRGSETEHFVYSLDFNGLHERVCKGKDFEDWHARVDEDGKPTCIMGHTQTYRRRKADAECFVDQEFKDPVPLSEDCKCTKEDYECDYNFRQEDGECVPAGPLKAPKGTCEDGEKTFMGSSGYRLIPGNTCVRRGGEVLDEQVERQCDETKTPPASGTISTEITTFKGDRIMEYYYLERCEKCKGDDETVIMRTDRREAYLTRDHGKSWTPIVQDDDVVAIYPHQFQNDIAYFITPSKKVYYTEDRGQHIHHFEAPEQPNTEHVQILSFHPNQKDWLIWTGGRDCGRVSADCQTVAHVSTRGGEGWEPLLRSVRKCQFVYREGRAGSDQLIYCEQYENEGPDASLSLLSSDDWFEHKTVLKSDVINFATMAEYIVVAVRDNDELSLKVDTSIDGVRFADAQFPSNFHVQHQQAYTVLDSSTHAVFLHVTVNNRQDTEYGSIVKSNSNGTSYVLSLNTVNRNSAGYVDFEKMQGLEGVAIVNVVDNAKEADEGSTKKLKTMITHNDGAEWGLIKRPVDPSNGEPFKCKEGSPIETCSLHLHGYSERDDPRETYSSPSAVGLMMGVGNVGEHLGYYKDGDTFITRDGGITWTAVAPGTWAWEYGDQGSIIVIVKKGEPVDYVMYSLNEGVDWTKSVFTEREMMIDHITTVPSDKSRNFLLWGKIKGDIATVNLDFSGLEERSKPCHLDESDPEGFNSDYRLWSPRHPLSDDDCLFGHIAQYHRKKPEAKCYNGKETRHLHSIARNCTCTRQDFECDFNFERDSNGQCKLVPGLEPPDPSAVCTKDPDAVEYYDVTGYRRIPLTTCQGGRELDYTSTVHPCPNHLPEFADRHGISGVGLFFAIVLPIAAASGIGYWVWKNWDGKFGRIQLGDGGMTSAASGVFDRDAPWIKYPVMAVSGIVAVIAALPMVVGSIYRTLSARFGRSGESYSRPYTSRSSFQRGRGDYAVVDPDEGELLGDDSDEEV